MTLIRPQSRVDSPVNTDRPFPAGIFIGEIVTPTGDNPQRTRTWETRDFLQKVGKSGMPQIAHDTHTTLSLWLRATDVVEADDEPGEQICFVDFVIADGDFGIMEIQSDDQHDGEGWGIHRSADLLANLAQAIGAVETFEQDGETYVQVAPNFLQLLEDGELDGQQVQFEVRHRKAKNPRNKAYVAAFSPAS